MNDKGRSQAFGWFEWRFLGGLLCCVGVACSGAWAQSPSAPVSVDDWVQALTPPPAAAMSRGFRPASPPSQDGLCSAGWVGRDEGTQLPQSQPAVTPSRSLMVVPYLPDKPSVQLALTFADDSDAVSVDGRFALSRLAQALRSPQLVDQRFSIAGHTNSSGSRERNLRLSCARALAVLRTLVNAGVAAERLSAYGFGPDRPLEGRNPEDSAQRRVEIRLAR